MAYIKDGKSDQAKDNRHYHKTEYEFYVTLQGKGILEVNGQIVTLEEENIIMVEPGERHFVKDLFWNR